LDFILDTLPAPFLACDRAQSRARGGESVAKKKAKAKKKKK